MPPFAHLGCPGMLGYMARSETWVMVADSGYNTRSLPFPGTFLHNVTFTFWDPPILLTHAGGVQGW